MRTMRTLGIQFTQEQRDWLQDAAQHEDRSVPWIVRNLVNIAMETERSQRPEPARRTERVKLDRGRRRAA
jgi:hypothetical protein